MTPLVRFVPEEQLRGPLWRAIQTYYRKDPLPIDTTRVGDPLDLPLTTPGPDVLRWAEKHGRILVSLDKQTMPGHFAQHLRAGGCSPGVFLVPAHLTLPQVIADLRLASYASDPSDWTNVLRYLPL